MKIFHTDLPFIIEQNISNFAASKAVHKKNSSFQDVALYPVKSKFHQFYITNCQSQALQFLTKRAKLLTPVMLEALFRSLV